MTIGAVALFWVVAAWPNGAFAIVFAAIVVILFSPRADQASPSRWLHARHPSTAFAAIVKFALLPGLETFPAFCWPRSRPHTGRLWIGPRPAACTDACSRPWRPTSCPFSQPTNPMSYDTRNSTTPPGDRRRLGAAGALSFRLLPPLFPAFRAQRLLELTLRDVRGWRRMLLQEWQTTGKAGSWAARGIAGPSHVAAAGPIPHRAVRWKRNN